MQLEIGSAATPLEKPDPAQDLAKCQRYYQTFSVFAIGYNGVAGGAIWGTYTLPVTMRAIPGVAYTGTSFSNASALTTYSITAGGLVAQATVTAIGQASGAGTVQLTADL